MTQIIWWWQLNSAFTISKSSQIRQHNKHDSPHNIYDGKESKVPLVCDENRCSWAEVWEGLVFFSVSTGSSAQWVGGHAVAQSPPLRPQHQRLRLLGQNEHRPVYQVFPTDNTTKRVSYPRREVCVYICPLDGLPSCLTCHIGLVWFFSV